VPGALQAHAWIALGKVCRVDEALAKKCVPLFVQVGGPPGGGGGLRPGLAARVQHRAARQGGREEAQEVARLHP
jgi:hypothetical protein